MCKNTVEQIVPAKYDDYTILEHPCGTISIYGRALYCDACKAEHKRWNDVELAYPEDQDVF